jgi:hypothetical protein
MPSHYINSYLSLSVTLFGYGPSLPELAFDYWAEDVVSEAKRSIIDMTSAVFPLGSYILFYCHQVNIDECHVV